MAKSNTKAVPRRDLVDEIFTSKDADNRDSTSMLEVVCNIAVRAIIVEMENGKKPPISTFLFLDWIICICISQMKSRRL